jgi:hypothetical protein
MDALKSRYEANKKKLSPFQERQMMKEIKRQCNVYWENHQLELMAMLLWYLHECPDTRWGKKKLKRFFMGFTPTLDKMLKHYEMETDDDTVWLCMHKLKDIGVDLREWQHEDISEEEVNKNET